MAAITVAAFLLALGVLALATRWFDLRFASPVRDLHALVSRATETNYQQDVSPLLRDSAASRELRAIIDNLSSLWAALRFGNAVRSQHPPPVGRSDGAAPDHRSRSDQPRAGR